MTCRLICGFRNLKVTVFEGDGEDFISFRCIAGVGFSQVWHIEAAVLYGDVSFITIT